MYAYRCLDHDFVCSTLIGLADILLFFTNNHTLLYFPALPNELSQHNLVPRASWFLSLFLTIACTFDIILPEMPTSWDLKSGDCLFFTSCPPPTPLKNWPSPQWEWLRTLYDFFHDVHSIKIRNHRFDARNNLRRWLNTCKNSPETVLRIRKIQVLS